MKKGPTADSEGFSELFVSVGTVLVFVYEPVTARASLEFTRLKPVLGLSFF
jgi:hypothetical protein